MVGKGEGTSYVIRALVAGSMQCDGDYTHAQYEDKQAKAGLRLYDRNISTTWKKAAPDDQGPWMLVRWIDPLRTAFAVTLALVALVWAISTLSLLTGASLTSSLCAYAMLWVVICMLAALFPLLPLIADYCCENPQPTLNQRERRQLE